MTLTTETYLCLSCNENTQNLVIEFNIGGIPIKVMKKCLRCNLRLYSSYGLHKCHFQIKEEK